EGGDAVEGDGVTGFGEVVAGGDGEVGFAVAGGAPEVEVLAGLEGFGGVDGGGVAGVAAEGVEGVAPVPDGQAVGEALHVVAPALLEGALQVVVVGVVGVLGDPGDAEPGVFADVLGEALVEDLAGFGRERGAGHSPASRYWASGSSAGSVELRRGGGGPFRLR